MTSLRQRTLAIARGRHAERGLFAVSFAESSFFPIPPDVILGPMAAGAPQRWLRLALICTVASVLGGLAGYAIGLFLFNSVGRPIIDLFGYGGREEELRALYAQWGTLVIFIKGLTPIPYKLVTIVSGAMHYDLGMFVLASTLTRGLRFLGVAWMFKAFGPRIAPLVERRLGVVLAGVAVVLVAALLLLPHLH